MAKKRKGAVKPGYRKPRTAREQAFWDMYPPDYRAWAVKKKLTLDEVSALAMGLDPHCVEHITYETGQTPARFAATKAWFEQVERDFAQEPGDLLGIQVFALDYHLPVDAELSEVAQYSSEGFLDQDELVAQLKRRIQSQQNTIEKLQRHIARTDVKRGGNPKTKRDSDLTRSDKTTSKLIVALLAQVMRYNNQDVRLQLTRLKNGANSNSVSQAVNTLHEMKWTMDEGTVGVRLKEAIKVWNA